MVQVAEGEYYRGAIGEGDRLSEKSHPSSYCVSHPVLKVNRMRTMYVPGSEIHVHSDYIMTRHITKLQIKIKNKF
jgi:hypothetical protein